VIRSPEPIRRKFGLAGTSIFAFMLFQAGPLLAESTDEPEPESWFRSEYAVAVQRLEKPLTNLRCKGTVKWKVTGNAAPTGLFCEADSEHLVKGTSRLALFNYDRQHSSAGYDGTKVLCQTPSYTFKLQRSVRDRPYVITRFETDKVNMARAGIEVVVLNDIYMFAAIAADAPKIKDYLGDPSVKIVRVSKGVQQHPELVEVAFDFTGSSYGYKSGRVILDTTLDWAIREYELVLAVGDEATWRSTHKCTVLCQRWGPSRFVFPKRVIYMTDAGTPDGTKQVKDEKEVEFSEVVLNKVSDAQFTLAAFGLPDLARLPSRTYYPFDNWLFWVCVLLAILSSGLLWLKYRRQH